MQYGQWIGEEATCQLRHKMVDIALGIATDPSTDIPEDRWPAVEMTRGYRTQRMTQFLLSNADIHPRVGDYFDVRNEIVMGNLGLVRFVFLKKGNRKFTEAKNDVGQEAIIRSVDDFVPGEHCFSTIACNRIWWEWLRYKGGDYNRNRPFSVPFYIGGELSWLDERLGRLGYSGMDVPQSVADALFEESGLPWSEYKALLGILGTSSSDINGRGDSGAGALGAAWGDRYGDIHGGGSMTLEEQIPDPDSIGLEDQITRSVELDEITGSSPRLTDKQVRVLRARFYEEKTPEETAGELDRCKERVRQIELSALRKLRAAAINLENAETAPLTVGGVPRNEIRKIRIVRHWTTQY